MKIVIDILIFLVAVYILHIIYTAIKYEIKKELIEEIAKYHTELKTEEIIPKSVIKKIKVKSKKQ